MTLPVRARAALLSAVSVLAVSVLFVAGLATTTPPVATVKAGSQTTAGDAVEHERRTMQVHYLEIVTPSVQDTCEVLAKTHGVEFGEPIAEFGNARTAPLSDGGRIGVRAPMRESEQPVVRPYLLVSDIEAAVKTAEAAGATVAIPSMEMPGGHGTFAIYILGGIEHGLWQR